MAFPVNGPGGITPKERPAIPTHPPPKTPDIKVKGDARAVAQEPSAGERVQPPDPRGLKLLRIVENSPMSPTPRDISSTVRAPQALTLPSHLPPPRPSGSVSSQGALSEPLGSGGPGAAQTPLTEATPVIHESAATEHARSEAEPQVSEHAQPDGAPHKPQEESAPVLEEPPSARANPNREPSARVFSDREIVTVLFAFTTHPDLHRPNLQQANLEQATPLAVLSKQLALHRFNFKSMSTKDVAKLFVAVHKLEGDLTGDGELMAKLTHQIGHIDEWLGERMPYVELDTLKFLLNASSLSSEGAEALSGILRERMPALQAKLMVELMGPIAKAVRDKSPSAASRAIEAAKDSFAKLDQIAHRVSNERDQELKVAMATALNDKQFTGTGAELKQILHGKNLKMDKKTGMPVFDSNRRPVVEISPNAVSRAAAREVSGIDAGKDREALNLILLKAVKIT
jgi:hypothetical protein